MMKVVNSNIDIDKLVEITDPSKRGTVVFSYLYEVLSKHPDFRDYFKAG